jgi:hypothetical protein
MQSDSNLKRKALVLVWIGEIWNIFEASIAIWAALAANSVALLAFGLDSLIELFAGAVIIWRFWKEREGNESETEKKAVKFVGVTFFFVQS